MASNEYGIEVYIVSVNLELLHGDSVLLSLLFKFPTELPSREEWLEGDGAGIEYGRIRAASTPSWGRLSICFLIHLELVAERKHAWLFAGWMGHSRNSQDEDLLFREYDAA